MDSFQKRQRERRKLEKRADKLARHQERVENGVPAPDAERDATQPGELTPPEALYPNPSDARPSSN